MYNSILHLLTNRTTGFTNEIFPAVSVYTAHTESADETYLRTFLKLREGDPEFYLVAMLAAVKSFPEIEVEFKETNCTFNLNDYRRTEYTVSNGVLTSGLGTEASVLYRPLEYPVPASTTLKYYDSSELNIVRGRKTYRVGYQLRTGGLMHVDWPEEIGITGVIDLLGNTWSSGVPITFTHTPDVFPFEAQATAAAKNNKIFKYLDDIGTLKMFNAAQSPIEKGAILGLSVSTPWKYVS